MEKFNARNMALALTTIFVGAYSLSAQAALNCKNNNQIIHEVHEVFMQDFKGGRLRSDFSAAKEACVLVEDFNGWDKSDIVKSFVVSPCTEGKVTCFKVDFVVLGSLVSGQKAKVFAKPTKKTATFKLVKEPKGTYLLTGLNDLPPQVSVEALRQHLETISTQDDGGPWARQALEQIKSL
jgi:hypothetical protein